MSERIVHKVCPLCGSAAIEEFQKVKDYSVSQEIFPVDECKDCSLRFTREVPDAKDISGYYHSEQYISHTDTQKGLIANLYHWVRKYTLRQKVSRVRRETQKSFGRHLDIGAGTGAFVNAMEQAGWSTVGVEPSDSARAKAHELYKASVYPMKELENFPKQSFNAITLWHVLEHVHDLHQLIERIKLLLEKEGVVLIAVPNYKSFDATYYATAWAAYDVPRHLYHFSPNAMQRLMQLHGMKIRSVRPMWFDSFYVSMLSEQYKNGSIIKAVCIALYSNFQALFNRKKCSSLIYVVERVEI
ncbi:MAG: class I SAM-dependent methyltransferase [Bacteroidetes bacterium]|nr:class I SAM-dependent methyltransferase [Bacteroidota bacterium]